MERKSLYDISWKVDEATYRIDPALSYSILAKYERDGFNNLEHLFDRLETPSLTFGSAVDAIITGGQEEFESRFMVAEFPSVQDSIIKIVKSLFNQYGKDSQYRSLNDIPDDLVIQETIIQGYQLNWKPETRVKVIKEKGSDYYNLLYISGDKTILDTTTYQDVCNAVSSLKDSSATKFYFEENNPFNNDIERLYQLKFKATLDNIDYRCMADLIIVDYKNKVITPIDLKTSSKSEWDFYKSFIEWNYQIQSRLYWRIIRDNLDKDPYFKDFKLSDYRFIVINRKTLTPLVWIFKETTEKGTLIYGRNNQVRFRDPCEIGSELYNYLSSRPKVPEGIKEEGLNNLTTWINKL